MHSKIFSTAKNWRYAKHKFSVFTTCQNHVFHKRSIFSGFYICMVAQRYQPTLSHKSTLVFDCISIFNHNLNLNISSMSRFKSHFYFWIAFSLSLSFQFLDFSVIFVFNSICICIFNHNFNLIFMLRFKSHLHFRYHFHLRFHFNCRFQ